MDKEINEVNNTDNIQNHKWFFERFKGDAAIYAFCPVCNFRYDPSVMDENVKAVIHYVYNYCPNCGEFLYVDANEIKIDRDYERHIIELYK